MKKQPTQTAYDLRLAAEAKARKAQPKTSLKSQLIAAAIVVPLATAAALVTWFDAPATTTAGAADQRAKVSQATPSELVQPAPKAAPAPAPKADGYAPELDADQKAQCVADEVQPSLCYKYLVALHEIEYAQMQQWRRGR